MMSKLILSVVTLLPVAVSAGALRKNPAFMEDHMSAEELETTLLSEIEGNFADVTQRGRLASIEAALTPMYKALPKNEHGKLGHTTVRYALHRLFVQRHGWLIKGLEPGGEHFNTSSPADVLTDKVPAYVEELFEKRLDGKGFSLHDTAVLASTIEHLIHNEAEGRLTSAYRAAQTPKSKPMNASQVPKVLDTYMKHYILSDVLAQRLSDDDMKEVFPGWSETQAFVRDVLREKAHSTDKFDFKQVLEVVEEIGERFGRFQNTECQQMKAKLVGLGDQGLGRVPIQNFYKSSLDGDAFEFQESPAYLRTLGVLDERENVIIANYLGSQSNCIASSNMYSVCCIDECESLMGHLERQIAAPDAKPDQILSLVSNLPSSSVEAPRSLGEKMTTRLYEMAETHGGTVQLHGRLFSQWMHHAYPRECPFPHLAGSTAPVSPDEWLETHGNRGYYATKEEMAEHASKEVQDHPDSLDHWIEHEELLVPLPKRQRSSVWTLLMFGVLAVSGVSMISRSFISAQNAVSVLSGTDGKKGTVLPTFSKSTGKTHML